MNPFIDEEQLEVSDAFADLYYAEMRLFDAAQSGIRDFAPINARLKQAGWTMNQRVAHLTRAKLLYQNRVTRQAVSKRVGASIKQVGETYTWIATTGVQ